MVEVKPAMKSAIVVGMIGIAPMSRRAPVATCPRPMTVAPCPVATHPNISGRGAGRCDLNDRRRHRRRHDNRARRREHGDRLCGYDRDR
jgi:hypothetical protein